MSTSRIIPEHLELFLTPTIVSRIKALNDTDSRKQDVIECFEQCGDNPDLVQLQQRLEEILNGPRVEEPTSDEDEDDEEVASTSTSSNKKKKAKSKKKDNEPAMDDEMKRREVAKRSQIEAQLGSFIQNLQKPAPDLASVISSIKAPGPQQQYKPNEYKPLHTYDKFQLQNSPNNSQDIENIGKVNTDCGFLPIGGPIIRGVNTFKQLHVMQNVALAKLDADTKSMETQTKTFLGTNKSKHAENSSHLTQYSQNEKENCAQHYASRNFEISQYYPTVNAAMEKWVTAIDNNNAANTKQLGAFLEAVKECIVLRKQTAEANNQHELNVIDKKNAENQKAREQHEKELKIKLDSQLQRDKARFDTQTGQLTMRLDLKLTEINANLQLEREKLVFEREENEKEREENEKKRQFELEKMRLSHELKLKELAMMNLVNNIIASQQQGNQPSTSRETKLTLEQHEEINEIPGGSNNRQQDNTCVQELLGIIEALKAEVDQYKNQQKS